MAGEKRDDKTTAGSFAAAPRVRTVIRSNPYDYDYAYGSATVSNRSFPSC